MSPNKTKEIFHLHFKTLVSSLKINYTSLFLNSNNFVADTETRYGYMKNKYKRNRLTIHDDFRERLQTAAKY